LSDLRAPANVQLISHCTKPTRAARDLTWQFDRRPDLQPLGYHLII